MFSFLIGCGPVGIASPTKGAKAMANETILIVDDDLDTLKLVGVMLQRQGYRIMAADTGPKALAMIKEEKPDLILLDIMMPEMDGFEVARRLNTDPHTADIPILMFTAKSQVDDKLAGFDAGADDYLTKPAHPAELVARVKKLLRQPRDTDALRSTGALSNSWSIGVIGAKGGLGASTIALNLGILLHQESKEDVVIADLRPGQGTIGLELGHQALTGLASLLAMGHNRINAQAIEENLVSYLPGLRVLLASFDPAEIEHNTDVKTLETIARQIRQFGRYVVFDLGASLQPATKKILPLCNEIIIVVDGYPNTVKISKALIEYLMQHGIGQGLMSAVLVNRTRSDVQLTWQDIQSRLGIPIATVIPPVPEIAYRAQKHEKPLVLLQPHGMVTSQLERLVRQQLEKSR